MITRRCFVAGAVAGAAGAFSSTWRAAAAGAAATFEVTHTDAEWRKLLKPDQYEVLRHEATERPFTSPLLHEERRGTFACAGCDLALFSSTTKFDSRTGWPSFWAPLDMARCGRLCIVATAAATWVTSSMTVRSRPAFATA
jgi:peptide-methionine (R)-S-oxide reductase